MSQDVLETSQPVVHCVDIAICAYRSSVLTLARVPRAVERRIVGVAGGGGERLTARASRGPQRPGRLVTSQGQHAGAYSVDLPSGI